MTTDDVFDFPQIEVPDPFDEEVETLVVAAYKATIDGIGRLDKQRRPRPNLISDPEQQLEVDFWDHQVSAMKTSYGNKSKGLSSTRNSTDAKPFMRSSRGRRSYWLKSTRVPVQTSDLAPKIDAARNALPTLCADLGLISTTAGVFTAFPCVSVPLS